ncbi:MAG: hypothetical protein ACI9LO_001428 [Planctomycetota bacterium]|jgi:hypothetical protein
MIPSEQHHDASSVPGSEIYDELAVLSANLVTEMLLRMFNSAEDYYGWPISDEDGGRLVKLVNRKQRIICSSFVYQLKKHFSEFKTATVDISTEIQAPGWQRIGLSRSNEEIELNELKMITSRYSNAFREFDKTIMKRLQQCIRRPRAHLQDNPIQVKRLCEAFQYAIDSLSLEVNSKLALYNLFADRFIETLGPFYRAIDHHLIEQGILTDLEPAQMLLRNRDGLSESRPPQSIAINPTLTQLMLLQKLKEQSGRGGSDFKNQFPELKQQLIRYGVIDNTECLDQLVNLFKFIFEDKDLPQPVKQQLARLQSYIYITAIQDEDFLTRSSNPARKLIDTIVSREVEFVISNQAELSGINFLQQFIDKLTSSNEVSLESYSQMLEHYLAYLAQKKNHADKRIKEQASNKMLLVVKMRLSKITRKMEDRAKSTILFDTVWLPLLLQIALRHGTDSDSWRKTISIVEMLAWSLIEKSSLEEQKKLIAAQPKNAHFLNRAMRGLKLDMTMQQSMNDYLKIESQNIIDATSQAILDSKRKTKSLAEQSFASEGVGEDFTDMMQTGVFQMTPEMLAALKPEEPVVPAALEQKSVSIEKGDWVEILQAGNRVNAKLAWKAADNSLYIFIDREGRRICEVDAETLKNRLISGDIVLLNTTRKTREATQFSIMHTL